MEQTPIPSLNTERAWTIAEDLAHESAALHGSANITGEYLAEVLFNHNVARDLLEGDELSAEVLAWLNEMAETVNDAVRG